MLKTPCIFTLFVLLFSISFSQCISGDCQIGFGTFKHTNGSIYIGEWWNGEMNGEGTLIWPDGPIYIGEFKNGLYHGNGTYLESYQDGVKLYIGNFKGEMENGYGTKIFDNGDVYVGEMKEGKMNGYGTLIINKIEVREGHWHKGIAINQ